MTRTLEVAEKAIRLIKEKIVLKTTQKITRIDITPTMVEDHSGYKFVGRYLTVGDKPTPRIIWSL